MSKLQFYRAQINTLNTMLDRRGGTLVFPTHSQAVAFRQKCYKFRKYFQSLQPNSQIPYDDLEIKLPRKGEPNDNILTFSILPRTPLAQAYDLQGNPIAIEDTAQIGGTIAKAPDPGFDLDFDLDLDEE